MFSLSYVSYSRATLLLLNSVNATPMPTPLIDGSATVLSSAVETFVHVRLVSRNKARCVPKQMMSYGCRYAESGMRGACFRKTGVCSDASQNPSRANMASSVSTNQREVTDRSSANPLSACWRAPHCADVSHTHNQRKPQRLHA
jgi:hypothetical protein